MRFTTKTFGSLDKFAHLVLNFIYEIHVIFFAIYNYIGQNLDQCLRETFIRNYSIH